MDPQQLLELINMMGLKNESISISAGIDIAKLASVVTTVSADYAAGVTDSFIVATAACTITLPAAALAKPVTVVNNSAGTVVIQGMFGDTIAVPGGIVTFPSQYMYGEFKGDGTTTNYVSSQGTGGASPGLSSVALSRVYVGG